MRNKRINPFNKHHYKILLASSSPRRHELMKVFGLEFETCSPDIDESPLKGELPRLYAARIARMKALAAAGKYPGHLIIASDTTVAMGRRICQKAENDEDVRDFLRRLSGRSNVIYTGLCVIAPDGRTVERMSLNRVKMKHLSGEEIEHYVASGEGVGKAGGYAIQGLAGTFIRQLNGTHTGAIGLPVFELAQILKGV